MKWMFLLPRSVERKESEAKNQKSEYGRESWFSCFLLTHSVLKLIIICFAFALSLAAVSCSKAKKPLSATELLDLGEKYMLELDYEEAISTFQALIEIDPKNEQAYVQLAEAYNQSGEPEKRQETLEKGYAIVDNKEEIAESLLTAMIDNNDAKAAGRLLDENQRTGGAESRAYRNMLQSLIDLDDTRLINMLIGALYEQNEYSLLALCLEIWVLSNKEYESDYERNDAINSFLLEREDVILRLGTREDFYFGGYDDEGKRQGFGICFYGEGAGDDISIYIGYWDNDLRNGEGTAYYGVYYYIKGDWTMDMPGGFMISGYTNEPTSEGEYINMEGQFDFLQYFNENSSQFQSIWNSGTRYID